MSVDLAKLIREAVQRVAVAVENKQSAVEEERNAKAALTEALRGVLFFKLNGDVYQVCEEGNLPRITILDLDAAPALPVPVHNPENISDWGQSEGYRLLDADEVNPGIAKCPVREIQRSTAPGNWTDFYFGSESNVTYRTKLSRAELAQARKAFHE